MQSSKTILTTSLLLASLATPAFAAEVMYARSSGDWKDHSAPGKYSAFNILDGDKKTVWCSEGTGQDAWLEIQFDEPVVLDKLVITMGNQSSLAAFKAFNRIKKMHVSGGDMTVPIELQDKPGPQTVDLDPVIEGDRLLIRFKAGYRGSKQRHTCISDAIFYSGRRALTDKKIKRTIRKARPKREFIDAWVSGPELNRTHLLVFGLNDRYRLQYVPHDPEQQAIRKSGQYKVTGGKPQIKIDRSWVPIKVKRDDAGRVLKIKLEGQGPLDGVYARRSESIGP